MWLLLFMNCFALSRLARFPFSVCCSSWSCYALHTLRAATINWLVDLKKKKKKLEYLFQRQHDNLCLCNSQIIGCAGCQVEWIGSTSKTLRWHNLMSINQSIYWLIDRYIYCHSVAFLPLLILPEHFDFAKRIAENQITSISVFPLSCIL